LGKPGKEGKAGLKGAKVRVRNISLNNIFLMLTVSEGIPVFCHFRGLLDWRVPLERQGL